MRLCAGSGPCCNVERAAEQTTAFVDSGSTRASNCDLDRACRLFFQLLIRQICAPNRPLDVGVQTGSIADSSDRLHGCHSPTWIRRIGGTVVRPRARLRPQIQGATRFRSVSEDESRAGKLPNSTRGESGSPARSMRLRFRESFGSARFRSVFMATTSVARTHRCVRASSSRRAGARFVGPRPAPRNRRRRSP